MRHHILIIDDEPSMCDVLDIYLTQYGFRVTTTTRGADALRMLEENHYHFVVLDIVLKDSDGLELLSEIKSAHPHLPVLMLTGLGFQEHALREAKRRGATGYLSRNLTTTNLLLEIQRQLNPPPLRGAPMAAAPAQFLAQPAA